MVCLLMYTTDSSVLLTEVTMDMLMGVFRNYGNDRVARQRQDILKPLISILCHVTTNKQQLLQVTISQGVVPLLCSWLVNASDLPPISYHRCLVNRVLSMLGGVAKLPRYCHEVSNFLSLDSLNTHLLSSNEFAHPVLRLLVVLSVLPEFASKLYSSVLLKTIFKLTVTSAITRVLLCSLKQNLRLVETNLKHFVSNWDIDIISTAKECSTCCKENGKSRPSLAKGKTAPTTGKETRTSKPSTQREETALLAVQLRGCRVGETISNFSQTTVKFITSVWEQEYQFDVEVYAPIKPEACSMTVTGSEVLLKLVKAAPGVWPRLTHGNQKTVHISIDFDRWEDKEFGILGANNKSWLAPPAASKTASYINPVLTDSDLDSETGSGCEEDGDEEEEEEAGKQAWQDDLDLGFGD
ncbi:hypothetical protein GBAR_LOCUS20808 [Geodia barretti]|uniref:RNA helicase n=1 Tax=Geodia barretti TaxID=519541 RepID=A0AA35SX44_GEOBA|nr:hypothetical protein GBAR_LOCUS20808 [Geodia barretti]